ncbi:MAG: sigma 54-interacting transcriptional regulator [Desulfobacterales bacterium]
MASEDKEFFREATLRLCSSLQIEKALQRCYKYVRKFIPMDLMLLSYISPEIGGMQFLAEASEKGGNRSDRVIFLPQETVELATGLSLPDIMVVENPAKHPVAKYAIRFVETKNPSMIIIRLVLEGQFLGGLAVLSNDKGIYDEEHANLLATLKEPASIALSNCRRFQEVNRLKELLADDNRYLQDELGRISGDEIVGADFGLKGVMEMVRQVALLASPVIIFGETGTGKEVIARAIHNLSKRREGPFIKVNCGAIPETLMDSELFGHEKGAYTGALSQKRGRFERADNGTIFLDEIGELPLEAQVRLLRVLQEKEIERLGGTQPINLDIRVIAATHRDLKNMIREGRFREDLFYRLQVFPISIPPLRQRLGDIPALVQHFITKKSREMGLKDIPTLAKGAIDRLNAYRWPGNVRELENTVERALILCRGEPLQFSDLQPHSSGEKDQFAGSLDTDSLNMNVVISRHIRGVLEMTGGRVEGQGGAAELLGINPGTLRHRMRKLGIPFGRRTGIDKYSKPHHRKT